MAPVRGGLALGPEWLEPVTYPPAHQWHIKVPVVPVSSPLAGEPTPEG